MIEWEIHLFENLACSKTLNGCDSVCFKL